MKTTRCSSQKCQAPIIWCETVNGKKTPVDAGISEKGTYKLEDRGDKPPIASYVSAYDANAARDRGEKVNLHESHWGTCIDRGTFVRKAATT